MQILVIANHKGGSGKTATTVNVASAFAERGLKVLVVDLDPQGSSTDWLGGLESKTGLVQFAAGRVSLSDLVVKTSAQGVDLLPTSPSLIPPGDDARNETGFAIVKGLVKLPDYWDLVLVDTPPALGYLSLAPLVAGDRVVIPVEAHALALPGVASVIASIQHAQQHINPRLELLAIIPCRVSATGHSREVISRLRDQFGDVVLDQFVREAILVAEAPALRKPVTLSAPTSAVANQYRAIAGALLDRIGDLSSR